jgi:monoamine oxidase
MRVAIIGGGPSGLSTALFLERKLPPSEIVLFEASQRLGGKAITKRFDTAPVAYEAGLAECYDYSHIGPDPLRALLDELDVPLREMRPGPVVLDGVVLDGPESIRRAFGAQTANAIERFQRRAAVALPLDVWKSDESVAGLLHAWSDLTWGEILANVPDPIARTYLEIVCHSDLATESHLTDGLNGLRNHLLDHPAYVRHVAVEGGMEVVTRRLADRLGRTQFELGTRVTGVRSVGRRRYHLRLVAGGVEREADFDAVIVALPHHALHLIDWRGEALRRAVIDHIRHFAHPGHYLRVSVLFDSPFWRDELRGSWFMLDAFGGCCVYDEGTRHEAGPYGVLGWLLAGSHALGATNLSNDDLVRMVLDSLPGALSSRARDACLESSVHRWAGAINAAPGSPFRDLATAQRPEPIEHPELIFVGDYFLDSTLNAVVHSARTGVELLSTEHATA